MKNRNTLRALLPLILCTFCALCAIYFGSKEVRAQSIVNFETSLGDIEIQLFDNSRPISVDNFLTYVQGGTYDGTIFHRIQNPSTQGIGIVQGGGFLTDGSSIPRLSPIINEAATNLNPLNTRGTIAFARTSVLDSATSEFFFNTVDNPGLDSQIFTVFGQVISGMDVVDQIQSLDTITASGEINFDDLPVIDVNATDLIAADNLAVLTSATVITNVPESSSAILLTIVATIGFARRDRRCR